jgi:hypothetical protein
MLYPPVLARAAVIVALAVALGGCTFPTEEDELSFKYTAYGGDEGYDQVLEIDSDGFSGVTMDLDITPLDESGEPIAGVTVTSAFGSYRKDQVIPPFFTDYDLLKFEGERANEVRDVRVEILDLDQVGYPEMPEGAVTYQRYDDGRPVGTDETFDAIDLRNRNSDDVPVRVALMAWGERPASDPQQFEWAIPLDDVYTVPANGSRMIKLPRELADRHVVSIETYGADPSHAKDAIADRSEWRVRAGRKSQP